MGDGQRAEAFADIFAGEAGIDERGATHGDGRAVVDAVVVDPLGIPVRIDRERGVVQDELGSVEEGTVILERVVTAHEGRDAAVPHRTGHGERIAADAAEIHVQAGSRTVETGIISRQVGDEVTGPGRAGDQAAAVHLAAVVEVADELGEAVEVEGAAEGGEEELLTRAVDRVVKPESDGAARDVGRAAPELATVQQQGAGAHLGERRAGDDLAGEVDRGAVGHLEEAGVGGRRRTQFDTRHRERMGDGGGTGGAAEEQVSGREAERGELRAGDVARGRVGHGEGVQGRTHRGQVVTGVSGGDLGGSGRDQGGIGERRRAGVTGKGDHRGARGRGDREVLGRGRSRGVGAQDEGGSVGDRRDGRASGDVGAVDAHAGDEAGGAGHGDRGAGVGGRSVGELDDTGVGGEIIAGDADAAFDAAHEVGVDRGVGEADLVADAETGDAVKVEDGAAVGVRNGRERERVITGAGHEDAARALQDLEGTGVLGGAGGVADQAEETIVFQRDRAAGDTAADDVLGGVVEGDLTLVADVDAGTRRGAEPGEGARAADDGETTVHPELTAEGVDGGEINGPRAADIERAGGRGAGAIDDGRGEIRHAGTLIDQDAVVGVVRKVDATGEGQGPRAGDVVIEIAVSVIVLEDAADFDRVAADELRGLAVEQDLIRDLIGAGQDDAVAAHGAAFELERARTERASLGNTQVALVKQDAAGEGVGRGTGELEDRAVGNRDTDTARGGGRIRDHAVPDGLRALATNLEHARVGVGLPVDVVTVDRQDRAVLEAVGQGAVVTAGELVDVGVDGDRRRAAETARRIVIDQDRLGDRQAGRIGREDGAVAEQDAAEDDIATRAHRPVVIDREGGRVGDAGDDVAEAEIETADVGTDRESRGAARRHSDAPTGAAGNGRAADVGEHAHRGRRSEAERAAVVTHAARESVGAAEDPDAGVGLVDTERLGRRRVGQDGGNRIEVGIDAAQLKHAVISRTEGGQGRRSAGIDDVGQGQRTGAAGLDAARARGTGKIDRAGRDFARTSVGQGDGIVAAGIAEFKPAARDVGTERRGRGAVGADGGDDELLDSQDGIAGVGVGVAQNQRTPTLLADVTRTRDDAGDRRIIQAGVPVIIDDDVAPTGAGSGHRDARGSGRGVLAEVDDRTGIETGDVGVSRNSRARDELTDGKRGDVTGRERDGTVRVHGGGHQSGGHGRVRADFEVTAELDLGQRVAGVEREGGTLQEVGGAVGIAPDESLGAPVDDELGAIGGETGETGERAGLPLVGARAQLTVERADRLEEGIARPVLAEAEVGSRRQGSPVDGDQRAAGDAGGAGVGVVLITERPISAVARTVDGQGAAVRIINEAEVDLVVTGGVTPEGQRTRTGAEVSDVTGVGEDEGGMVIRTTHDRRAVAAVGLDFRVARQGEETVDRHGRRLRRHEDVHRSATLIIGGLRTGVVKRTTFEDERGGIGGRAGGIAATDRRILADVGQAGDGQGASADDGGAGVVVESGEGLRATAILDDRDDAGGLVDQTVQRAVAVTVAEIEDGRRGVGIDHAAGTGEGADDHARSGGGGIPIGGRGAGGVKVENRTLTERDVGIRAQGGGRTGELDGTLIDIGGTGVGAGSGEDEQPRAGLGERTPATREQGTDGQRVSGRRAIGRDDDLRGGSPEGAAGDGGRSGAIIKEHTSGTDREKPAEGQGLGTGQLEGVDRFGAGDGEIGGGKVIGRGREAGGCQRSISREGRGRGTDGEPIDTTKGGPTTDDTIGTGRSRGEGDRAPGQGDIERGTGAAGGEGGESQGGGAAAGRDGLDGSLAGRGGQRAESLGARGSRGAFVTEDTTGGVAEGIDIEDERGGIRQDIDVGGDFAKLEHAVRNGRDTRERVVRGRSQHPSTDAHLLQAGGIGTAVVRDDRSDDIIAGVRAAESEGLGRGA